MKGCDFMYKQIPVITGYNREEKRLIEELQYLDEDSIEAFFYTKYNSEIHKILSEIPFPEAFLTILLAYIVKTGGAILRVYTWPLSLYREPILRGYLLPRIEDPDIKEIISNAIEKEKQKVKKGDE